MSDVIYEPITAALIMGSVGVKQAEMTSEDIKSSLGKRRWINAAEINHPKAIVGTTMISRLFA